MIKIDNYSGRFGNKIIHYYNLRQIADLLKINHYSIPWEGFDIFEIMNDDIVHLKNNIHINGKKILDLGIENFINESLKLKNEHDFILDVSLGDLFFKINKLPTYDIFKFKDDIELDTAYNNVGIHFRGTDFFEWQNGNGILEPEYYINSINLINNEYINNKFYLFTDDTNLNSYRLTRSFLKDNNLFFEDGNINNYFLDFKILSNCDVIISSPSTFSISAGFCGKKLKKIIHSEKWINYILKSNDIFWVDFVNGGNENYKLWKKII